MLRGSGSTVGPLLSPAEPGAEEFAKSGIGATASVAQAPRRKGRVFRSAGVLSRRRAVSMETYHRPMTIRPARLGHALHKECCLFCRRHDGGFDSEEHVFAYALGNRDYVLPPGVVCDRCNNGPLQTADKALSSFPPIEMLRAERGRRTRKDKGLVMKMNGSEVWWESPGELRVRTAKPGVVTRTGPSSGKPVERRPAFA